MGTQWILVADSAHGILYERKSRGSGLERLAEFDEPRGRAHEGDLVTGGDGAVFQSAGDGQQRQTEPEMSTRDHVVGKFASTLADALRDGRLQDSYQELVLIAPPAFLGTLRESLDENCRRLVGREIDKNVVQLPTQELEERISAML